MKNTFVISLGGSLIVQDKINLKILKQFEEVIKKHTKENKFVVVCGGGSVARIYISALRKAGVNKELQSFAGISATRMNARFINYLFNKNPKKGIPHKMRDVKKRLKKEDIVICGALEYKPDQTSDSTAAEIAKRIKAEFINLTNVRGLYDRNPLISKNAKFIDKISWEDFYKRAKKIKFKPGQHFVLDQTAAKIIKENKITTYILGKNMGQLDKLLKGEKFIGTIIKS